MDVFNKFDGCYFSFKVCLSKSEIKNLFIWVLLGMQQFLRYSR